MNSLKYNQTTKVYLPKVYGLQENSNLTLRFTGCSQADFPISCYRYINCALFFELTHNCNSVDNSELKLQLGIYTVELLADSEVIKTFTIKLI